MEIFQIILDHINSIQLVASCLEKEFKHEMVYGPIVADLKDLEENGVIIPKHEIVKGSLAFITGDNLGSHTLSSFVENFSKTSYFCRYCLVKRDNVYSENSENVEYQRRTKETYIAGLRKLKESLSKTSYEGVKFDSIFNKLSNFHVCMPGLPPCIGHDLFEGIVTFDLALYILLRKNGFRMHNLITHWRIFIILQMIDVINLCHSMVLKRLQDVPLKYGLSSDFFLSL